MKKVLSKIQLIGMPLSVATLIACNGYYREPSAEPVGYSSSQHEPVISAAKMHIRADLRFRSKAMEDLNCDDFQVEVISKSLDHLIAIGCGIQAEYWFDEQVMDYILKERRRVPEKPEPEHTDHYEFDDWK
ncbi:MAG: hypothetical protein JXX14_04935 [Deltaproteobacteria bacterium]|nr:hypothetical protein [Deltaproteobacteria bacterium]